MIKNLYILDIIKDRINRILKKDIYNIIIVQKVMINSMLIKLYFIKHQL